MTAVTPDDRLLDDEWSEVAPDEWTRSREALAIGDGAAGRGLPGRVWDRIVAAGPEGWLSFLLVAAATVFVYVQVNPGAGLTDLGLVWRDNTPTGGDMGAHVWGPAYIRDHLLPEFRLNGWTPDWYAGFPAFQFYMIVPMLAIIVLNVGLHPLIAAVCTAGWAGLLVLLARHHRRFLRPALVVTPFLLLLLWPFPYGVAFKLVVISGLVAMPVTAWALGKLCDLPFPIPPLFAGASLLFLFDRSFNIFGGNVASTMAGEFAFSIAITLSLVTIGLVARGLDTGRHRALAAVLIAVTGLCHLIVAFFVLLVVAVLFLLRLDAARLWTIVALVALPGALAFTGFELGGTLGTVLGGVAAAAAVALVLLRPGSAPTFVGAAAAVVVAAVAEPLVGAVAVVLVAVASVLRLEPVRSWWTISVGVVAGLLSAFWVLPFWYRGDYVNDMGWTKLVAFESLLFRRDLLNPAETLRDSPPFEVFVALAVLGFALSLLKRRRLGVALGLVAVLIGFAFVHLPEGRLWNGRILPFYYLSVYLLAAIGIGDVGRTVAAWAARRAPARATWVRVGWGAVAFGAAYTVVALPLGAMPGGRGSDGVSRFSVLGVNFAETTDRSFVTGWARWNFSGLEGKTGNESGGGWSEYRELMLTMDELGRTNGCGRALWEFSSSLDRYGTTMAPMLLPHWTDGCIGSMEGLYFESSTTTPYHFLMQSELSEAPSRAQRDLEYPAFDMEAGVRHLQLFGVRYYMAFSPVALQAAREHPDLSEVAASGPWVIFEVADSDIVEGLAFEPVVWDDIGHSQAEWLEASAEVFLDPERWDALPAAGGPDSWRRVHVADVPEPLPIEPAVVTDVVLGDDSVSFTVDEPGKPVLVKISYFPNWRVSGAEGPWRITPNLMVVVPTDTRVELTYGRTPIDWLSYALSLAGLVALVALVRRPDLTPAPATFLPLGRDLDDVFEPAPRRRRPRDIPDEVAELDEPVGVDPWPEPLPETSPEVAEDDRP
jgi:hypothetical protein